MSQKISLNSVVSAVSSSQTELRQSHGWRWLGLVFLAAAGLALLAPAGQAQAVSVTVNIDGDAVPGAELTLTAEVDEGTIQSISWTQIGGAAALISPANANPTQVTLGEAEDYKEELFHVLAEPPIGPDELPPNIPVPEGEFPGGLQDRFQVQGMSPWALEEAGMVTIKVEVSTTEGDAEAEVEIHAVLPWKPASDIESVPIGKTVLLHGKDQASYNWALTRPAGSAAALTDAASQNPDFTPDIAGTYQVTVTDEATGEPVTLKIYAGTWEGIIVGQDEDGRPVPDSSCLACHNDGIAPDKFTPWAQSGHAEIFSNMLDTNTHYGEGCFSCHTVGFDTDAANDGFDDAPDYEGFLASGLINNPGDNWTTMLATYPDAARLGNIQCANCHGPQRGHTQSDARRSISSDVCAVCHGEPARHGRFQQWQLSGHANYELAIEEGEEGGCARCHTGNGFISWQSLGFDPAEEVEVTWTADEVHPQTCVVCHDPHSMGTLSGEPNNATVRVAGDTPLLMSGFVASDVGRGAICMVCHNARRGLRNDDQPPPSDPERAPHQGPQSDVLMGQNAYFVDLGEPAEGTDYPPGLPGAHASLADSCATCHMEQTPPPPQLSYNQGGTNHTFYASEDICSKCHSFTAEEVLGSVETNLEALETLIEESWYNVMVNVTAEPQKVKGQKTPPERFVNLDGEAIISSLNIGDVDKIIFGETSGRQALTVIFIDGTEVGPIRLGDINVQEGVTVCQKETKTKLLKKAKQVDKSLSKGDTLGACDGDDDLSTNLGTIVGFASPDLTKAGWNYILIHGDGSHGAHNPSFANSVLAGAINALADDAAQVQVQP
jgi:hypothetical protein